MKKPKIYSYNQAIYPVKLDVIFDDIDEDTLNKLYGWASNPTVKLECDAINKFGDTYDDLYNKKTHSRTILVLFYEEPTVECIAHEAFHVMNGVMKAADLEFDADESAGNEHLAYLLQWIVYSISNALEEHKKSKKKKHVRKS